MIMTGTGLLFDPAQIATAGGIIGAMAGAISYLMKSLLTSKNDQIDFLKGEVLATKAERDMLLRQLIPDMRRTVRD